jgi:hypothetical protein
MTLDDLAAEMRKRFTESKGAAVSLTAEEWTVLADAIYLRDALVEITAAPESASAKAKVAKVLARHGRR